MESRDSLLKLASYIIQVGFLGHFKRSWEVLSTSLSLLPFYFSFSKYILHRSVLMGELACDVFVFRFFFLKGSLLVF